MKKITLTFIKSILPTRRKTSSKIDGGKVVIVGGGKGLYGAGILAALAATRSGAGYTHLMTDLGKFPWLKFPDFIVHPLLLSELKIHHDSVIAMGPGLGLTKNRYRLLSHLLKTTPAKVILDGDALTILSQIKLQKLPSTWILTPHEGELARLLNVDSDKIKKNRLSSVKLAQKKFGCLVILKGADTLIATPNETYIVSSGTTALAKAGSGDVLVGMMAAFYAQKGNALEAALLGTFIHGQASGLWLKEKNDHLSMRPVDLIEMIPKTLLKLRK